MPHRAAIVEAVLASKQSDAIEYSKQPSYTFSASKDGAEITTVTTKRIKNERDLIKALEIDTDTWMIDRFLVSKSEGYRKDRKVEWHVENGQVVYGNVNDTGKLLIKPLFSVKVWLKRKGREIRERLVVDDLKRDAANFAPKYKKIVYVKRNNSLLYEIAMPDLHIGKMTWDEESGESSNLKSQMARVRSVLTELLAHGRHYSIKHILLPIGNDFFNVDNIIGTTTNGTPQQEDTRWQKTFRAGRQLAVEMIDMCASIAPVTVLQIPGNHDEARNFYLGDALFAWYRNCKNVTISNTARQRKYFQFGNTLLGFTHGEHEKVSQLANIMAFEEPNKWASSKYREWHVGHWHRKEDLLQTTTEQVGVVIRILRSLTPTDAWHFKKGYVGAVHAAESFLWSETDGLLGQFTVVPKSTGDVG